MVNGRNPDSRLRRWLIDRRDRLREQRLVDATFLRLQGEWDPTPQQYLAARAAAARRLRLRRPLALTGLVLASLAVVAAATLGAIVLLQGSPGHTLTISQPPVSGSASRPQPDKAGSSPPAGRGHHAGAPPVLGPVPASPSSGTHTARIPSAQPTGAVAGTGTPVPAASPTPSPAPSPSRSCLIRLLGLCL